MWILLIVVPSSSWKTESILEWVVALKSREGLSGARASIEYYLNWARVSGIPGFPNSIFQESWRLVNMNFVRKTLNIVAWSGFLFGSPRYQQEQLGNNFVPQFSLKKYTWGVEVVGIAGASLPVANFVRDLWTRGGLHDVELSRSRKWCANLEFRL